MSVRLIPTPLSSPRTRFFVVARHMAERYSANKIFLGFIGLVDYVGSKFQKSSIEEGLGFFRLFALSNERRQEEEGP